MLKRYGVPTLYLFVVFVCGLALGIFGYRLYEIRTVTASTAGPRPPEEWKKRHLKEMKSRLNLTDEQTSQLSDILDQTRADYHDLMEKSRPDMERIQANQYSRVKALLTPAQVPEYEKFHAEREAQRRADEHNKKF